MVAVYLSVFLSMYKKSNDTCLITCIETKFTVSQRVSYLTSGTVHLQVEKVSKEESLKRKKEKKSEPKYVRGEVGLQNQLKKQKQS